MLKAAKERLSGTSNVSFVEVVADRIPLKDHSVDAAVAVLVLHLLGP